MKREEEVYLFSSLFSLISAMSPDEKDDCLIVVFVAEVFATVLASLVINLHKILKI